MTSRGGEPRADSPATAPRTEEEVVVRAGRVRLSGHLCLPGGAARSGAPRSGARGIVVFAHGSGSSRLSPRNHHVADLLHRSGLGTLLFDLLTRDEESDRSKVFDIELLGGRLLDATRWLRARSDVNGLPIGYFGASTGAAAALWAAAEAGAGIAAVVSRGGRPDLAGPKLPSVVAPTLLIVGGRDDVVLELNRQAQARLRCTNSLAVVPGATHLFEEPGTLDAAAELASEWFVRHLALPTRKTLGV